MKDKHTLSPYESESVSIPGAGRAGGERVGVSQTPYSTVEAGTHSHPLPCSLFLESLESRERKHGMSMTHAVSMFFLLGRSISPTRALALSLDSIKWLLLFVRFFLRVHYVVLQQFKQIKIAPRYTH